MSVPNDPGSSKWTRPQTTDQEPALAAAASDQHAADPAAERFTLDRDRLRTLLTEDYGEDLELVWWHEDGIAAALSRAVWDAEDAIQTPTGLQLQTYPVGSDALVVCVRERRATKFPLRQIASYSIETKHLVDAENATFDECCEAIGEMLNHANQLLPALRALQAGERHSEPDTQ